MLRYIKAIQKIDRDKLPHAEKQALIQIAILIFENNLTPDNQAIGDGIGENKDYVKNILTRLKSKGFINPIGRGKKRRIDIIWEKVFGNSQLPNDLFSNSQLPNQAPKSDPPLLDNVVVVLLEKYGFDFGPVILEKLIRFPVSTQIKAIESTKAYSILNPARYIERILDNDCKGIQLPDKPEKIKNGIKSITDEYEGYRGVKVRFLEKIYIIGDAGEIVTESGTHPFFRVKQMIENKIIEVLN